MAATVIDFTDLAAGRFIGIQQFLCRQIQRLTQNRRFFVVRDVAQMLERGRQSGEFTQRVPAQVPFFQHLLHMLRRRAAGTRFKQSATVHQRYDGQHLGAGTQFQDREQVGQVITQHIAGNRDGVFTLSDPVQRKTCRVHRRHDQDFQAIRIVIGQVFFDLADHFAIVGTVFVQPEHGRRAGCAGAIDGQLDPVLDRRVLGQAGAPQVAFLDVVLKQDFACGIDNAHHPLGRCDKGLRVRSVFFRLLGHQPDIRYTAHGRRIEGTVCNAELDGFVVDAGITAVGDHA